MCVIMTAGKSKKGSIISAEYSDINTKIEFLIKLLCIETFQFSELKYMT